MNSKIIDMSLLTPLRNEIECLIQIAKQFDKDIEQGYIDYDDNAIEIESKLGSRIERKMILLNAEETRVLKELNK